jgi:hypothetical protein
MVLEGGLVSSPQGEIFGVVFSDGTFYNSTAATAARKAAMRFFPKGTPVLLCAKTRRGEVVYWGNPRLAENLISHPVDNIRAAIRGSAVPRPPDPPKAKAEPPRPPPPPRPPEAKPMDPWQVLGVPAHCSEADLIRGFRLRVAENHPDQFAKASPAIRAFADDQMKQINGAYQQIREMRRAR